MPLDQREAPGGQLQSTHQHWDTLSHLADTQGPGPRRAQSSTLTSMILLWETLPSQTRQAQRPPPKSTQGLSNFFIQKHFKCRMTSLICGIYREMMQTNLQDRVRLTDSASFRLPGGRMWGGCLGVDMYTLPYLKQTANKGLPHSTGHSAQCYVAAWMGESG